MNQPLSDKEKKVYKFIEKSIRSNGYSPTYRDIQSHFEFKSVNSVADYIRQLTDKGYLMANPGKRGIFLAEEGSAPEALRIPLSGIIAAGLPIEAIEGTEFIDVPKSITKSGGQYFALRVKGDSMQDEHIIDGDIVVIRRQRIANNGETVAAIVDSSATLKKYYRKNNVIELHPANSKYKPIKVEEGAEFEILGVLSGVIRKT
jgi:repressor LexA